VSASKSIIKLIGNYTSKYAQGYFQYDSKKSGGITLGHLRFSDNPIRSTYYVQEPSLVVCTKDTYLDNFEIVEHLNNNGIFILNTNKDSQEIVQELSPKIKKIIKDRNISFYIIDAYKLAQSIGLSNKISTIMESIIVKLSNIMDYDTAKKHMKEYAKNLYGKKGPGIVESNYKAIEQAPDYLEKINLPEEEYILDDNTEDELYKLINNRQGNNIPVSKFLNMKDGTFEPGLSNKDKRRISNVVPKHIIENCIMCNQCAFVCPHSVIRPFLIDEEEYKDLPENIKKRCLKPVLPALKEYHYVLAISAADCTGCGLCISICPAPKGKALEFQELNEEEQEIFDYLDNNIKDKGINPTNVINSQFVKPKFAFNGACAGCGETPYLKVLTQLFGNEMVVANATGCSSIYSASAPSTAYSLPWASSLFEDNAEYGYGMLIATKTIRNRIKNIMEKNMDNPNQELFKLWIDNMDNYDITKEVYEKLDYNKTPVEINELKDYLINRTIWMVGGDGWAYDIGYGGIDHILSTNDNFNILVLDSQVYSNTGGQTSKASPKGVVAAFASTGKIQNKKDLARIALAYPHVYVAQISMGASMNQMLKVLKEAKEYNGPSIIIAYSPCIEHGIKGGMGKSVENEKLATSCGYFPIFSYNPRTKKFTLDSINTDFDLYDEFLQSQTRYSMLKAINPNNYEKLLNENKKNAIERFNHYKDLHEKNN
ncbi:MAG: 2-oxoacid:acceptor oxidoreductase family protein, partial [Bacilli bacterium]|nr:2-oxoacid:acceptor oxidoreductase family protein [Bacilli bacterium]